MFSADVVSVFGTEQEAISVASGHPGAVPRMLARESDLIVIGRRTCDAGAVQVKAPDGSTGWSVATSLKSAAPCPLHGSALATQTSTTIRIVLLDRPLF